MKKNSRITLWVMAGGFLLAFVARIFQIIIGTDMMTGFLYNDNNFFEDYGIYVIAVISSAGALFGAVVDGKRTFGGLRVSDITDGRAAAIGFALLLTGMCAAYEGYKELSALTPSKFVIFVDFAFGAAMIVIAFVTLYFKEFRPALGFSYAAAALYFTLRGVNVFLDRMVITTVPEYLIECLSVIGGGVFFMLLAKFLSGNEQKNTKTAICAWGVPTAVLTLASSLATIVCALAAPSGIAERITSDRYTAELFFQMNGGKEAYMLTFTPWVNAAMGLFIVVTLIVMFMKKKESVIAETDNENQQVAAEQENNEE